MKKATKLKEFTGVEIFRSIQKELVLLIKNPMSFREALLLSKIVTQPDNTSNINWGKEIMSAGYYIVSAIGTEITLSPTIPMYQ